MSDESQPQPRPPAGAVEPLELEAAARAAVRALAEPLGIERSQALLLDGTSRPEGGERPPLLVDLRPPPAPLADLERTAAAVAERGVLIIRVEVGSGPAALGGFERVRKLPVRAAAGWLIGEASEPAVAAPLTSPDAAPAWELLVAGPAQLLERLGAALALDASAPVAALLAEAMRWEARSREAEAEAAASLRDGQLAELARRRAVARVVELERTPLRRLGRLLRGRRGEISPD